MTKKKRTTTTADFSPQNSRSLDNVHPLPPVLTILPSVVPHCIRFRLLLATILICQRNTSLLSWIHQICRKNWRGCSHNPAWQRHLVRAARVQLPPLILTSDIPTIWIYRQNVRGQNIFYKRTTCRIYRQFGYTDNFAQSRLCRYKRRQLYLLVEPLVISAGSGLMYLPVTRKEPL